MTYILLESNVSVYVLFNSLLVSSFRLTSYVQINKCPIVPCLSLIIYCFAMHELLSSFANSIYIYTYLLGKLNDAYLSRVKSMITISLQTLSRY